MDDRMGRQTTADGGSDMSEKNRVNRAIEQTHSAIAVLEAALVAKLPDDQRRTLEPMVERVKKSLNEASAALAVIRHTAKEAIESL